MNVRGTAEPERVARNGQRQPGRHPERLRELAELDRVWQPRDEVAGVLAPDRLLEVVRAGQTGADRPSQVHSSAEAGSPGDGSMETRGAVIRRG